MLGENHFSVYTGITLSQEWFLKFKYPWVLISSKVIRISACVSFTDWLVDDGSNLCSLVPVLMGYFLLWSICLGHFHGSFSSSCFGKLYLLFILLPCLIWQIASCGFYFAEQERWKRNWWFSEGFFWCFSIISGSSSCPC